MSFSKPLIERFRFSDVKRIRRAAQAAARAQIALNGVWCRFTLSDILTVVHPTVNLHDWRIAMRHQYQKQQAAAKPRGKSR